MEENTSMMRGQMKDIKKENQMKFLEMIKISEMKNTLDGFNSKVFTIAERISEFADMETIQNENQSTSSFYLQCRELQSMPFPLYNDENKIQKPDKIQNSFLN